MNTIKNYKKVFHVRPLLDRARHTWLVHPLAKFALAAILLGLVCWRFPFPITAQSNIEAPSIIAIVAGGGGDLYMTPGGELMQRLPAGTALRLTARSADNSWAVAQVSDDAQQLSHSWIPVAQLVQFGIETLPIRAASSVIAADTVANVALPTVTPTPIPTLTAMLSPTATLPPPLPAAMPPAAASSEPTSSPSSQLGVTRAATTTVYSMPGATPIATLATGTVVQIHGRTANGQWLLVELEPGTSGWVDTQEIVVNAPTALPVLFVDAMPDDADLPDEGSTTSPTTLLTPPVTDMDIPLPSPNTPVTATVALTDSRLNIRSGPSGEFAILAKALPGETFVVHGRNADGTWLLVESLTSASIMGWASAQYLLLTSPISIVPVVLDMSAAPIVPAKVSVPQDNPRRTDIAMMTSNVPEQLAGQLIIQAGGNGAIYHYELGSGDLRWLTTGNDPALSPDGRTIVFVRGGGENGLYTLDLTSGKEQRIYTSGEALAAPTWSPDGNWIAFTRVTGNFHCRELPDGSCLLDNPYLGDFTLVTKLEYGLSVVDRDGSNFHDLPALTSAAAPNWSERGIAYHTSTSIEITQDAPRAVTKAVVQAPYYQDPVWLPNSDRLIFQSREGNHWEIFAVGEAGGTPVALTRPVTTLVDKLPSNVAPTVSPDGQWIAYLSSRDAQNSDGPWRVWVMTQEGTDQRPLEIDLPLDYSYNGAQPLSWGREPS